MFYIQVIETKYFESAQSNAIKKIIVRPARGVMLDRTGKVIAYNRPFYDINFIPKNLTDGFDTLGFCEVLKVDKQFFINRINFIKSQRNYSQYKTASFISQLSREEYAEIQERIFQYPEFFVEKYYYRSYPYKTGGHVFGYLGEVDQRILDKDTTKYYVSGDIIGIVGLERQYEVLLRGEKGIKYQYVDVKGRPMGSFDNGSQDKKAISGGNLNTTLNIEMQELAEKLMINKIGSVVAIEPQTGEILAMVSSPTYDPNLLIGRNRAKYFAQLATDPTKPLFNRPLKGASYPPGSTFKAINGLIGLQEGVITTETQFSCSRGYHGVVSVGCHVHSSPVNFAYSITTSCNSYYSNVFLKLIDRNGEVDKNFNIWYNYVKSFGIGTLTGVDLPGELKGSLPTVEYYNKVHKGWRWRGPTIISLAIGQGELGVSPLQLANMCAVIANRGYYVQPHFNKSLDPNKLNRVFTGIKQEYYNALIEAMYGVMEHGTGAFSKIKGIEVCGKTGTAENPHGKDHSIFIAFAPKDNPKIAIATYVENSGFGATWAAPISSLLIEKYLVDSISRPEMVKKMVEGNLLPKPGDKKED